MKYQMGHNIMQKFSRNWFTNDEKNILCEIAQAVVAHNNAIRMNEREREDTTRDEIEMLYHDICEMSYTGSNAKFFAIAHKIYTNAGAYKLTHTRKNAPAFAQRATMGRAMLREMLFNSQNV